MYQKTKKTKTKHTHNIISTIFISQTLYVCIYSVCMLKIKNQTDSMSLLRLTIPLCSPSSTSGIFLLLPCCLLLFFFLVNSLSVLFCAKGLCDFLPFRL